MSRNKKIHFFIFWIINSAVSMFFFSNCGTYEPEKSMTNNSATREPTSTTTTNTNSADPLYVYQWHLKNTGQTVYAQTAAVAGVDLNIEDVWAQGIKGSGIKIQVSDDGVEDWHEDLSENFQASQTSKDYTKASPYLAYRAAPNSVPRVENGITYLDYDFHATSVAGLIAAVQNNGKGGSGVAPKASISSANPLSVLVDQSNSLYFNDQLRGSFDISNMSWGTSQGDIFPYNSSMHSTAQNEVKTGRNGNGKIYVKSAGNDFSVYCHGQDVQNVQNPKKCIANSGFDQENNIPYFIIVGALNSAHRKSSYSSTGSNLWVSSFGGEFGDDSPAMLTTDRTGCTLGDSRSTYPSSDTTTNFQKGLLEINKNCNYTSTFNGTSSAAPIVSGVIALMLEANPNLSWRDIKYILALTARKINPSSINISHPYATAPAPHTATLPTGMIWDYGWTTNTAGFNYSNLYGFGSVDAAAAVAMAKTMTPKFPANLTETPLTSATPNLAIGDNSNSTPATSTITIPGSSTVGIEYVQIKINISHANFAELKIELQHNNLTKSILVNPMNSLEGINLAGEDIYFTSNAFYQELSSGTWTLKVYDAKSGTTGTLTSWGIRFGGTSAN